MDAFGVLLSINIIFQSRRILLSDNRREAKVRRRTVVFIQYGEAGQYVDFSQLLSPTRIQNQGQTVPLRASVWEE